MERKINFGGNAYALQGGFKCIVLGENFHIFFDLKNMISTSTKIFCQNKKALICKIFD